MTMLVLPVLHASPGEVRGRRACAEAAAPAPGCCRCSWPPGWPTHRPGADGGRRPPRQTDTRPSSLCWADGGKRYCVL